MTKGSTVYVGEQIFCDKFCVPTMAFRQRNSKHARRISRKVEVIEKRYPKIKGLLFKYRQVNLYHLTWQ